MVNLHSAYALSFAPQHHYGALAAVCLQGLFSVFTSKPPSMAALLFSLLCNVIPSIIRGA